MHILHVCLSGLQYNCDKIAVLREIARQTSRNTNPLPAKPLIPQTLHFH